MSDAGLPLGYQRDFLQIAGDIIDHVKFIDHPGYIAGYPKELIQEKIRVYRENGIPSSPGGIAFEIAHIQGKVTEYFHRAAELGFQGVEISEDTIPESLSLSQRDRYIKEGQALGLEIYTELGRKFPDSPLERKDVIKSALHDLSIGAKKVVIENSDLVELKSQDPGFFLDVSQEVGKEHLVFEVGPAEWPTLAVWIINTLGPDINVGNVPDTEIIVLDAMRRKLHRNIQYIFFAKEDE
jgi:phosphosulfolactate synthase